MKEVYKPHHVHDYGVYEATYYVKGKVHVVTIDPRKEDTETLTIYDSIGEFEKDNRDQLEMQIHLDTDGTGIEQGEFDITMNAITEFENAMNRKGISGTKDKPYVRQAINDIFDQLNKAGELRQSVVEQLTYTLKVIKGRPWSE